jgi:hypothetical protein
MMDMSKKVNQNTASEIGVDVTSTAGLHHQTFCIMINPHQWVSGLMFAGAECPTHYNNGFAHTIDPNDINFGARASQEQKINRCDLSCAMVAAHWNTYMDFLDP